MKRSTPDGCACETAKAVPILFLGIVLTLSAVISCRRPEKTGTGAGTPPAGGPAPAAAPASAAESAPSIRSAPEPDRPPFSGLNAPRDAAFDDKGRLWIADFGDAAVRIFDGKGGFLGGWGGSGSGTYQLKDPCAVAIRGDDVYVADTWNGRVTRFSLAGEWKGKTTNDFYGPRGVAVAPDGRVWIADTGNGRVVACDRDLSNPRFFGKTGSGPDQLSSPVGIAVGPSGLVYVADSVNSRVQILDGEGRFRGSFPFKGWGANTEPYLEVDDQENVYASDPGGQAVVELDRKGRELKRWTADDAGKKFAKPTGLALDRRNGTLRVVNTDTGAIGTVKVK